MKKTKHSRILSIIVILAAFFSLVGCENKKAREKRIQIEEQEKVLKEELRTLTETFSKTVTIYNRDLEAWPKQKSAIKESKKKRVCEKEYDKAKRKLDLYKQELKKLGDGFHDYYYDKNFWQKADGKIYNWGRSFILKMEKLDEELLRDK